MMIKYSIKLLLKTKCTDITILQCTSAYPTPISEVNLKVISNVIGGFEKGIDFEVKGIADDKWGNVIAVLINKSKFNINQVQEHCKKYLPEYMVPKYFMNHTNKHELK